MIVKRSGGSNHLSSEVFRELERHAVKKGFFKPTDEELVQLATKQVKAEPNLKPTKSLEIDLCNLISGLRDRGLESQASDLEVKFGLYKVAENDLYNIKSDDVVDFAHRDGTVKLFNAENGLGEVETIEDAAKRIRNLAEKDPMGSNSDDARKKACRFLWSLEKRGQAVGINDEDVRREAQKVNSVISNLPDVQSTIKFSGTGNEIFQNRLVQNMYTKYANPTQRPEIYYAKFNNLQKINPALANAGLPWKGIYNAIINDKNTGSRNLITSLAKNLGVNVNGFYEAPELFTPVAVNRSGVPNNALSRKAQSNNSIFITNSQGQTVVGNRNNVGKLAGIINSAFQNFYNKTWANIKTADLGLQNDLKKIMKKLLDLRPSLIDEDNTNVPLIKNNLSNIKKDALNALRSSPIKVADILGQNLVKQYLNDVIKAVNKSLQVIHENVLDENVKSGIAGTMSQAVNLLNKLASKTYSANKMSEMKIQYMAVKGKMIKFIRAVNSAATDNDLIDIANAAVSPKDLFKSIDDVRNYASSSLAFVKNLESKINKQDNEKAEENV